MILNSGTDSSLLTDWRNKIDQQLGDRKQQNPPWSMYRIPRESKSAKTVLTVCVDSFPGHIFHMSHIIFFCRFEHS